MGKLLTTEKFIEKSKKIHGYKYNYSKVNYVNYETPVKIICPIHGDFHQKPNYHLSGRGCYDCGRVNTLRSIKTTQEEFISLANIIHNNKYDYSMVKYRTNKCKVKIICPMHGIFVQIPSEHINGKHGCIKCAGLDRLNTPEFIKRSQRKHNDKYNYSLSNYINNHTKVKIICPKHGNFSQIPHNHLQGQGCPKCSRNISSPEIEFLKYYDVPQTHVFIKPYFVDGYDPKTNSIYEFLGDYWHGNPNRFHPNDINVKAKKTYGSLYKETMNKFKILKEKGYNVKYIWEKDWKEYKNNRIPYLKILNYI